MAMRLEQTAYLGSLLLSGSLALGGCGDDGGGTGEGSAGTSTGDSADTTAGMVTTEAESVDTTAGGGMTTTDGPVTDPTMGEDSTTEEPPPAGQRAFRFNSIELRDPTSGALIVDPCDNNETVNDLLANSLTVDMDGDGNLDMGFVLNFPMLDQSDGAVGSIEFANAVCTAPDGASCGLLMGSELYATMYSASADGTCLEPDPAVTNPELGAPAESTTGPCFVTDPISATVVTSTVTIPLTEARIAARFVGEPAGNLVEGTIQGFLSQADAAATNVELFGQMFTLDELLCPDHADGEGWWMHMSYTALTTEWTG